jgi:hypothetical protein
LGAVEDNVHGAQWGGVGAGAHVFSRAKEEKESNTDNVGNGKQEVTRAGSVVGALHDVIQNGNWDGLDTVGRRIGFAKGGPGLSQTEILFARGGQTGIQGPQKHKCLANSTYVVFHHASPDRLAMGGKVAITVASGKDLEEYDWVLCLNAASKAQIDSHFHRSQCFSAVQACVGATLACTVGITVCISQNPCERAGAKESKYFPVGNGN